MRSPAGGAARHPRWPQQWLAAAGRGALASTASLEYLPRRFAGWAVARTLAPISLTGISLLLGVCAAAWFSGGTGPDNLNGVAALGGCYLAAWAAQLLISPRAAAEERLAGLAAVTAEYAVYAGLAAGAGADWTGGWELAAVVLIGWSVRHALRAVRGRTGTGLGQAGMGLDGAGTGLGGRAGRGGLPSGPPGGSQVVLIAVVAPLWGARITLLVLLSWAVSVTAYAVLAPAPGSAGPGPQGIARLRDDGPVARWLGALVRGHLAALPPALAGLAATATVILLGLRNLPGLLVLTPVVAMLLAAPGASYRHAGRLDWLVPVLLQAGQFGYIAALGFSDGVPAPLTYALCAMIALSYLAWSGQTGPAPAAGRAGPEGDLGWEGRMLVVGLSAAAGITLFAYAALTAYLGVLICSKIMTISHPEGASR